MSTDPVRPAPPAGRSSRARRALLVATVTAGITLSSVTGAGPALGASAQPAGPVAPAPVAPTPPSPTGAAATGGAAPQDARAAADGPQTWAPPLAGATTRVEVRDGAARLSGARDGRDATTSLRGAQRQGFLDLGAHQFGSAVNRLDVPVAADVPPGSSVEVDVRGQGADGQWTEWTPAVPGSPAVLDEPTRTVGVRLALLAPAAAPGPVVRKITVRADQVATGPRVLAPRASYRVYATREGLTGGTTANGHKITPNDQFVALPSRRALSPNGRGDYSVRICSDAKRCATVPVWDIGPWNTADDYWSPAAQRQQWQDLPQGRPQAAAAYENKYNGGKDGFGRDVKNPAGIDLADGTFYGLGLKTNSFVTVEYLWTARSGTVGRAISPVGPVLLRPTPDEKAGDIGVVGDGAQVDVDCQVPGSSVVGSQGTSNVWLRVAPGQYAPAAWIQGAPPVPACGP